MNNQSRVHTWKKWMAAGVLGMGLLCLSLPVQAAGKTIYVYDASNRLISVTTASGKVFTYQYDKNGNLLKIVQSVVK